MSTNTENKTPEISQAEKGSPTRIRSGNSIIARGEPMLWLTGGSLLLCAIMIIGLLALVIYNGAITFWPGTVYQFETIEIEGQKPKTIMGEVTRTDYYEPAQGNLEALPAMIRREVDEELERADGLLQRRLVRTGNYDLTNEHFNWISEYMISKTGETTPEWATVIERLDWGRFYGFPDAFVIDGEVVANAPDAVWNKFNELHPEVRERFMKRKSLETVDTGIVNARLEHARLDLRKIEIQHGLDSQEWKDAKTEFDAIEKEALAEFETIREEISALDEENERFVMRMRTADGKTKDIFISDIVRAYTPNRIGVAERFAIYFDRVWEFLSAEPREANSEGGVYPAIFGTVVMTLIMTIFVVPFGVLAALYLREYATAGPVVSAVRIAVNNLAGVPSIVFGVFGLGFFIYIIGSGIDNTFYYANLPNPTFGKGGILWAALTLSLLTLPVVIVATEEALAAVPGSMRAGSYACGASKWQTIQRIVLPRAMPGITTGAILAMARGAGEVAPLMLVGAVKLAPELPIDGLFPFIHPDRSFMHLGFHIYDLGFQSQNSEAAKPMVFTTTLLLILIILVLNLAAIIIRSRLRKKFAGSQF
jgi:phosphate transport system permease protein